MSRNSKIALIIGGAILVVLVVAPLIWAGVNGWPSRSWGWGMMGPGMMWGFGGMWFMPILMIVFWGLIIWGIVALVRGARGGCCAPGPSDSALDILKRRYAAGEITKEEFEDRKKTLA